MKPSFSIIAALMQRTGDPLAEAFAHRDPAELVPAVLKKPNKEYGKGSKEP